MDPETALTDSPTADDTPAEPTPATTPIPETLDTDANYLCGPAGTGKTWLARAMVAQRPGTLLCATTGIAAVNLGEGTTINAALKYFDTDSLKEAYLGGHLTRQLGRLYKSGVRRLLIDEVSMMAGDQLTYITRALDELGDKAASISPDVVDEVQKIQDEEGEDRNVLPLKITLVGDFAQLPPVKAPFAFESQEWSRYGAAIEKLTVVRRQADQAFIGAIHAARMGQGAQVADYFGPHLHDRMDDRFDGTTILAKNEEVDRYNRLRLDAVAGTESAVLSTRWGVLRGDWKNIPEKLLLKPGALVMLLSNVRDPFSRRLVYANGDLGHVRTIGENGFVTVELTRNGREVEVEWVTRDNQIPLEAGRIKELKAAGHEDRVKRDANERARWELIGGITYLPLRLAYAATVHKCQGLTLDSVQVNMHDGFFKTPGMAYVALSRARTLAGLRLVATRDQLKERCTVHAKIKPWL